jgi:hypothetical protein
MSKLLPIYKIVSAIVEAYQPTQKTQLYKPLVIIKV